MCAVQWYANGYINGDIIFVAFIESINHDAKYTAVDDRTDDNDECQTLDHSGSLYMFPGPSLIRFLLSNCRPCDLPSPLFFLPMEMCYIAPKIKANVGYSPNPKPQLSQRRHLPCYDYPD